MDTQIVKLMEDSKNALFEDDDEGLDCSGQEETTILDLTSQQSRPTTTTMSMANKSTIDLTVVSDDEPSEWICHRFNNSI